MNMLSHTIATTTITTLLVAYYKDINAKEQFFFLDKFQTQQSTQMISLCVNVYLYVYAYISLYMLVF